MKYLKTFESFKINHIKELETGDTIHYQGSEYEVIEPGEFAIKVKSPKTGYEFMINQSQLKDYGIHKDK